MVIIDINEVSLCIVDGHSFFKLERCNFSCNRGVGSVDDFGSAVSTWLVNNVRDKQSIPQNEIIDWSVVSLIWSALHRFKPHFIQLL